MTEPRSESAPDSMLARMEGLIAAMKNRAPSPREDDLGRASTLLQSADDEADAQGTAQVLERGAVVGRFVVLQELGAGGMGVVYAAYDPELDRKVAIKLLLPGAVGPGGRARLLREAQTLGKLSHPNVVAVYDVGTVGEQVWLAMEFVPGQTLRRWLDTPRGWNEVVEVMRRAGEGLAAAHAAELLHRDFKPDNVMVGDDGRVRVMDFGLARMQSTSTTEDDAPRSPDSDVRSGEITRAGAIVGTPGYMAPEQLGGAELTAAVDQFAFCITLWEALYGERPFGGTTWMQTAAHVLAGRLRPPPKGRAVPGWLRRACERGLAAEPTQRWPSMHALLDTLATGRKRARVRRGLAVVGALALLGAGGEGYRRYDIARRTAACHESGNEIATAWNPEREHALRDAIVATGVSYAATTADRTVPWLATQAEQWRDARVEACLDTDVHGTWDAKTLDRSLWCLDERRTELASLVDELTRADPDVVQKAVSAAAGLSAVGACRDEDVLHALEPPDEAREAVREVRAMVTTAHDRGLAGRYAEGLELAQAALEQARALEWPPLAAKARLQVGSLLVQTGAYADAEPVFEEAYFDAINGVAPDVAAAAATNLAQLVGVWLSREADGRRWGRHAEAALADGHDGQGLRRANLLASIAQIDDAAGARDDAKRRLQQSLAMYEEALGHEHPGVAKILNSLAVVRYNAGAYDEALDLYERAHAIREQTLGHEHPTLATGLNNIALVHTATGAPERAIPLYERSLAIWEAALGQEHPLVATSLANLGMARNAMGDFEAALALHARALAIREKKLGPDHVDVAVGLVDYGNTFERIGAYDRALALHQRALAIFERAHGPEHPSVATSLSNLGSVYQQQHAYGEAEPLYTRALGIFERTQGSDHPNVAHSLMGLAEVALALHQPAKALPLAERALAIRERNGVSAHEIEITRFVVARASWDAPASEGGDRSRAVRLAMQARDALQPVGKAASSAVATIDRWLAEHREDGGASPRR